MTQQNSPPTSPAMNSLTPHLVCARATKAIAFYTQAFHAVEQLRLMTPNGKLMHAALQIGNSLIMLAEESPEWGSLSPLALKGSPVTIHLVVPDVDAAIAQAVAAGARVTMPVADMFWGDRYGQIVDPFGHRWSLATPGRRLTPTEMQEALNEMMADQNRA